MVTWTDADVSDPGRRPGTFVNFTAEAEALLRGGLTGVVSATVKSGWGPVDRVVTIETADDVNKYFSNDEDLFATSLADNINNRYNAPYILNSILAGGASKVLVKRLVGPGAVNSSLVLQDSAGTPVDAITVSAKYPGRHGNKLTVQVRTAPGSTMQQILVRDSDNNVVETWTSTVNAGASSGIVDDFIALIGSNSEYISLAKIDDGNGTLSTINFTNLSGGLGDEQSLVLSDYTEAMTLLELENFERAYFDTTSFRTQIAAWVLAQRGLGKRITYTTGSELGETVVSAVANAGSFAQPHIEYVSPGSKADDLSDTEQTYPGYLYAAQVTGAIAGLPLTVSPTFLTMRGIKDVETRYGNSNIRILLAGGVLTTVWDGARFKLERGINTLKVSDLTSQQNEQFTKIKVMRILDNIHNVIRTTINNDFIGKVPNNASGIASAISVVREFLNRQVLQGLVQPEFTVEQDPSYTSEDDRFFLLIGIQPVDSMEFGYFTIAVG